VAPFGGPRRKLAEQMRKAGKSEAQIKKVLNETFGPEPKKKAKAKPKAKKKR